MVVERCYKKRYSDETEARLALKGCKRSKNRKRNECSFYPCDICGGFHLTSKLPDKSGFRKT